MTAFCLFSFLSLKNPQCLLRMLIQAVVKLSFIFFTSVLKCIWDMKKQCSKLFYYTCCKDSFSLIGNIYHQLTPLEKKKYLLQEVGGV